MVPATPIPPSQHVVSVPLADRGYSIFLQEGGLTRIASVLERENFIPTAKRVLVVTDTHVAATQGATCVEALQQAGWQVALHALPAGETSKSLGEIERIYDALVALRADRNSLVITVGGGVVGDAGGFAAATYNRGIGLIQVPTSLLAMVDSSVGGKVGINHRQGKNLIGAFHQPRAVLIDPLVLETLPEREFRGGLAEVVKYGVILDAEFFDFLENHAPEILAREPAVLTHLLVRSCELKAYVVERDEKENSGLRAILNYGHTFAHAYEALAGYGRLTHGEAVAVGMVHAGRLAERRGLIGEEVTQRQRNLLATLGLPLALPTEMHWEPEEVIARMRLDKKNIGGVIRFVLPRRIGEVDLFDDVPEDDVRAVLSEVF